MEHSGHEKSTRYSHTFCYNADMFVIEVMPLRRGLHIETLSYFGSEAYPLGTLLSIPVRNQTILGLVSRVEEVSTAKTALRAATFSLRKVPPQTHPNILGEAFIKTAHELALLYATSVGHILFHLLPPVIRDGTLPLPHAKVVIPTEHFLPEVLHAPREERLLTYRSIVRETFAHAGSILIVVPTSIEAEKVALALQKGIEERVILLTTTQSKRQEREAYRALEDFSQAKLIIATPSHAVIERHDIARIIIEECRSPHYKERTRPYLDLRDVLTTYARHTGRMLLLGDILPRTEEEYLRRSEHYLTFGQTPKRIALTGTLSVIVRDRDEKGTQGFTLFPSHLRTLLSEVQKKKKRLFVFSARRGLAPLVTCAQCHYIFRSEESGTPYSLLRTIKQGVEERWFVSHTSGERIRALDLCPECGSWKLKERGIGVQYVHDELKKILGSTPLFVFDHTTASTWKRAHAIKDAFYHEKAAVLLGTTMALPYLTELIDDAIITSMDALLTTPTWRLEEDALALMLQLREITKDTVYVVGSKDHELLTYAKHGEVERFYTDEIALREKLNYPPFTHFIHLTWQAPPPEAKKIEAQVKESLAPWSITTFPSPTVMKDSLVLHGLIRIPSARWPDSSLSRILRELPPHIRIVHNPDRLV